VSSASVFPPRALAEVFADDVRLARLGRRLLILTVLLLVAFAGYYAYDRYFVTAETPIDRTVRQLEDKVRQSPNDVEMRMRVASGYAQQHRYDQAITQYQEVLKLRSDWLPAIFAMASTEAARGNSARAEELYRLVADRYKDNQYRYATKELQVVYYQLGKFALDAGRAEEAVSWTQEALQVDPTDGDALYLLGQSQEAAGDATAAEVAYVRAAAFDPNFLQAYAGLERTASLAGDTNQAAYARGMQHYASGNFGEALSNFQQLVNEAPDFAAAYEGLGLAYAKGNNADQAIKAFSAALERDPNRLLSQWSLRSLQSIQALQSDESGK
jgi:tetratricopeptide (TPR) repeat protein